MKCSLSWCDKEAYTRGWCRGHYSNWYKLGVPNPASLSRKIGTRTLLAKSCVSCGCFKQAPEFNHTTTGLWSSWCHSCTNARRSIEELRKYRARRLNKVQDKTLSQANNWGKRWTPDEDQVALDQGSTMVEKALELGRSFKAIDDRIYKLHKKGKR